MSGMNRRDWMKRAGLGTLAALGSLQAGGPAMAIPPIGRTRPSHLKLSIAAYSYRDSLKSKPPKMDMFDFASLAADMGLDAVEPTSYYFPENVTTEYLHRFKKHAFTLGLDISGTAVGNNFCLPPGSARDQQIESVKTWIDRAAELDAPVIRIFAGSVPKGATEEQAAAWAIEGMNTSLEYAAKKGVILALENHGGITSSTDQLLRLVKAVDSPYFGVNLDTGNFHTEDPYGDLAKLAPYAVNVQVKTEIKPAGSKTKIDADLARFISILREARYSGYVVLEYEAAADPMTAIPKHIKTLRSLIQQ